jgi:hypothetical protein
VQEEKSRIRTNRLCFLLSPTFYFSIWMWGREMVQINELVGANVFTPLFWCLTMAAVLGAGIGLIPRMPRRLKEAGISHASGFLMTFLLALTLAALDIYFS